ncbi:MAG TPA: protein translocase subunit SecD [Opitutaceae bacterium]|nr:protein translocase subunit SecD [Opitutaceae bacterium]
MLKRNLWKILLSLAIVAWAVAELIPLKDIPFPDYVRSHATANRTEFNRLMDQANALVTSHQYPSDYVALKQLAKEQRIDISKFFPKIDVSDIKNVDRRNDLLLAYLDKQRKSKIQLGLDLKGGVAVTLEMVDSKQPAGANGEYIHQKKIEQAIDILTRRINGFGVAEPLIRPVGNNRIEVQVPGIDTKTNPEVIDAIKKPARLEFRLVKADTQPTTTPPTDVPPGYEVLSEENENDPNASYLYYIVKRIPEMTGQHISQAIPVMGQFGNYQVELQFDKTGAKQFADVTTANVGRLLAIVLDGKLSSAPRINEPITGGNAQITGRFTQRDAEVLASNLNNPLDSELIVKAQNEVGPSLAQDAIDSGIRAAVLGTALVACFMITYYVVGGVVAVITLAMNLLIILAVMGSFGATMTLPGLAGIVLTMGMAVDANILIFERMREELKLGKTLRSAVVSGYDKAFVTIVDAHVTQLCICGIMIWLGTGPIKGFGVTLAIGVFSTMFSVLITSHLILEWLVESNIVKKFPMLHFLHVEKVDFVKYGKPAFIASWCIVLLGIAVAIGKGQRIYGIDFAGGDVLTVAYQHEPDLAQIRSIAAKQGLRDISLTKVTNIGGGNPTISIETPPGKSAELLAAVQKQLPQDGLEKVGEESIGPAIGKEIEWNAVKALLASFAITLLYIALRFEVGFGVGAVVASLHDILMTIGIFVLFGHQFNAPMVAAILSIAGYSINDTVVVFDRIREELKLNPTMKLRDVINLAMNRVFSRSIMTSVTTFLAALALFVFGTGVMKDISFTFLVGIITGTFSSIYIASPVFYWWHKGDRKHVEAHSDVAPKYEWQGTSKASE